MSAEKCTPVKMALTTKNFTSVVDVIRIPDPYVADYTPPDEFRNFDEERRITREVIRIIAELPDDLVVRDAVLMPPDDVPEELRTKIREHEPYLLWAAGKEANVWLSGGPAHIREAA
jgi:hypothetical protein